MENPNQGRNPRTPAPQPAAGLAFYLTAAAVSALTTAVLFTLFPRIEQTNIAMLFLAALIPVAMKLGRGPATLAAVLNVLGFDVFFVEPRFTLVVDDLRFGVTFAVMLVVGLIIARLTAGLKAQAAIATRREQRTRALYELARQLAGALREDQIAGLVQDTISAQPLGRAQLLLPDRLRRLVPPGGERLPLMDLSVAQWCFDLDRPAGATTGTLPDSSLHYLPLKAPMRVRGVLVLALAEPRMLLSSEMRQHMDTIAALAAIALERVHFVTVAQETALKVESQRLRESLLSALSHDLRTPITAIAGIAETLANDGEPRGGRRAELLDSLHRQAQGMARLVANILDMARFESDREKSLRLDWQSLEELIGAARNVLDNVLCGRMVIVDVPHDFPLLRADGVLIERVLVNLLENAAKYVPPEGRIGITARTLGESAEIEVWDDGPGLPGDPEKLFNKFARGSSESPVAGVGLGLAICRTIIEAHGGAIHAQNRSGGGAAFIIRLPLETMPDIEPEAAGGSPP